MQGRDVARFILACASWGVSYTPSQVLDMTGDERDAMASAMAERAAEQDRERALSEARQQARAGRRR